MDSTNHWSKTEFSIHNWESVDVEVQLCALFCTIYIKDLSIAVSNNILVQIFDFVLLYLFPRDTVTNYCEVVALNDILS